MFRKHIFPLTVVLLLAVQFASCLKNEVTVKVKLPESVTDAYRLFYYASDSDKGWYAETSVPIQNGVGEIKCNTVNPTVVFVMRNGNLPPVAFYAERGDNIKIEGNGPDAFGWRISGNKVNEEWTQWRLANKEAMQSGDPKRLNAAVKSYVDKVSDKKLSTILLLLYYDRRRDEDGFRRLWKKLKGEALNPALIRLLGRTDMIDATPMPVQDVKEIIVGSAGTGADTLRIGKKPLLLYLWREDNGNRDECIAKLKSLRKESGDSASALICDISFDYDSITWRRKVKGDSLSGVVRGWLPMGETDSVVRRLGVERTPCIIVFDKKGKQVYRGDDMEQATSRFRNFAKR